MTLWQQLITLVISVLSGIGFVWALQQCWKKNRSFSHPPKIYGFFGAFVWADLVVFGLFWALAGIASLLLNDWILFLLITSLFWLVRAIGETMYWFNQQFTPRPGNEPEKFWFHKFFHNDSVWFVYQIYWQCVTVVTILTSLYLAKLWLA
jgi:hypothetical protein